jgi:hypothetical protein
MRPSEPIVDYLGTLERELNFDAQLSRRVRREVEDHLRQAAAAEPVGDESERQCRALGRFGMPKEIASQYVTVSLLRQSRATAALLVLVTAAIFAVMKGRGWWYEVSHWPLNDQLAATAGQGVAIARGVFLSTFAVGVIAWTYVYRFPDAAPLAIYKRFKRGIMLAIVAAALLLCTLAGDVGLTTLRLIHSASLPVAVVPIAALAIELSGALMIVLQIRRARRTGAAIHRLLTGDVEGHIPSLADRP